MSAWLSTSDVFACTVAACTYNETFWYRVFLFAHYTPLWLWVGSLFNGLYANHDIFFILFFLGGLFNRLIHSFFAEMLTDTRSREGLCLPHEAQLPSGVTQQLTFFVIVFVVSPVVFARVENIRNIGAFSVVVPISVIGELALGTNDVAGVMAGVFVGCITGALYMVVVSSIIYPLGRRVLAYLNTQCGYEQSMTAYVFHYVVLYPFACQDERTRPTGMYDLMECILFADFEHARPSVHIRATQKCLKNMLGRETLHDDIDRLDVVVEYVNGCGGPAETQRVMVMSEAEVDAAWERWIST
jgi:hypothetical protein